MLLSCWWMFNQVGRMRWRSFAAAFPTSRWSSGAWKSISSVKTHITLSAWNQSYKNIHNSINTLHNLWAKGSHMTGNQSLYFNLQDNSSFTAIFKDLALVSYVGSWPFLGALIEKPDETFLVRSCFLGYSKFNCSSCRRVLIWRLD